MPTSIYVSEGEPRRERGYGRDGNPGWEALEEALGGLEDAEAVAFASGQAASMALMLTLAQGRERIVLPADGYYGARLLADKLRPHGAEPVHVDLRDLAAVERELKGAGPPGGALGRDADQPAAAGRGSGRAGQGCGRGERPDDRGQHHRHQRASAAA